VTEQAAAEQLPFRDAEFDQVLCRYTTHHWQTWKLVCGKLAGFSRMEAWQCSLM